jgi:hypothetical protein
VSIAVCIPSIGMSGGLLHPLVDRCLAEPDVDVVEVWDNQEVVAPIPGVDIVRAPGLTIYDEWNCFASTYGATHDLAILNDDIAMAEGTLPALAGVAGFDMLSVAHHPNLPLVNPLRVREAKGTFRQNGICGWAFVVRQGCWPEDGIDSRFQVWYGDDDLVWKLRRDGRRVGVHEGVSVRHEQSTTVNSLAWVPAAQAADGELWRSLGRP